MIAGEGGSSDIEIKTSQCVCVCLCVCPVPYLGSQEVSCSVDEKSGDIVFSFESCQMNAGSEFLWKKNYKEITDFSSIVVHTEGSL